MWLRFVVRSASDLFNNHTIVAEERTPHGHWFFNLGDKAFSY